MRDSDEGKAGFVPAPAPPDEAARLEALRSLEILDTEGDEALDEITRLASEVCGTPIALISLVDESRLWCKSKVGITGTETPREQAFCAHAILGHDVLVVPDALADPRFAHNPAVIADPRVRFYAGAPLFAADGHALGTLSVMDRRSRRLTDRQLAALRTLSCAAMNLLARRDLERRLSDVQALAEGIAHDLNNTLAPVLMTLDFLKRLHPDARSQRLISAAQTCAERGARMVQQILGSARGAEADEGLVQAHHLMKEMEKLARETFAGEIQVAAYVPRNLHLVAGNATQIHQVLLNLCVNARDAMPEGGTLTLSARNVELDDSFAALHPGARAGRYVALAITDTGAGIPADARRQIFEPFFTTKENGKGTGLGLSTSLRIVERHGGFIDVDSEVGKGSTFTVYLPAAAKAEASGAPVPDAPLGQGERILVVDDEAAPAGDGAESAAAFADRRRRWPPSSSI